MKKIISLISVLALLLSMMTTVAFADAKNKLEWEEVEKTESTLTLKLVLTTDKNIKAITGGQFSLAEAKNSGVTKATGTKIAASNFNVAFARNAIAVTFATAEDFLTGRVELGTVTFTLSDSAKSFTLPLNGTKKLVLNDENNVNVVDSFDLTAYSQEITIGSKDVPATAIKLDKTELDLDLNGKKTGKITAIVEPTDTTDKVAWDSKDKTIATVDENGNVTAVAEGKTTITATIGKLEPVTCTVTVKDTTPPEKSIVDVTPSEITGDYGTKTLKHIANIVKNADATAFIKVTKTLNGNTESKTTTQTIAELLGGVANDGALITADVAIGVLTADTDAVFSFGLVK